MNFSGNTEYTALSEVAGDIPIPYLTDFENSLFYNVYQGNTQSGVPLSWTQEDLDGNVLSTFAPAGWLWQRRNCNPFFDAKRQILIHQVQVPESEFVLDYSPGDMVTCIIVMRINKDDFANSPYFLIDMDQVGNTGATPVPPFGNPDTNTVWGYLGIDEKLQKVYMNYGGNTSNYTAVAVQYDESNVLDNLNLVQCVWGNLITTGITYQAPRFGIPSAFDYDNEIAYVPTAQVPIKIDFKNESIFVQDSFYTPGSGVRSFIRNIGGFTLEYFDDINNKIRLLDSDLNQIEESDFTFSGAPYFLEDDAKLYTRNPMRTLVRVQSTADKPVFGGSKALTQSLFKNNNFNTGALFGRHICLLESENCYLVFNNEIARDKANPPYFDRCILRKLDLSGNLLIEVILDDIKIPNLGSLFHEPYFDIENRKIYAVQHATDDYTGHSGGGQVLRVFEIDFDTGAYTSLGSPNPGVDFNVTNVNYVVHYYNPDTQVLYYTKHLDNDLYKADFNSGTLTSADSGIDITSSGRIKAIYFDKEKELAYMQVAINGVANIIIANFGDLTATISGTIPLGILPNNQPTLFPAVEDYYLNGFNPNAFRVGAYTFYSLIINTSFDLLSVVNAPSGFGSYNGLQVGISGRCYTSSALDGDFRVFNTVQQDVSVPLNQTFTDPVNISEFSADDAVVVDGKVMSIPNRGILGGDMKMPVKGSYTAMDYEPSNATFNNQPTVFSNGATIYNDTGVRNPSYDIGITLDSFKNQGSCYWLILLATNPSPNRRAGFATLSNGTAWHFSNQFKRLDLTNNFNNIVFRFSGQNVSSVPALFAIRIETGVTPEGWLGTYGQMDLIVGTVVDPNFDTIFSFNDFAYSTIRLAHMQFIGYQNADRASEIIYINSVCNALATKYGATWTNIT